MIFKKKEEACPRAVKCPAEDVDSVIKFLDMPEHWRVSCRTIKAIERRFRAANWRRRLKGVFSERTSMERILFAVSSCENNKEGVAHILLVA